MLTEVDTSEYEEQHRKRPWGRGHWAFIVVYSFRAQGREHHYHNTPYSIAKRRVLALANREGAKAVVLDSFLSSHWPTS